MRNLSKTTCNSTDDNLIARFNQLKKDIELIEKDLSFYKQNVIEFYLYHYYFIIIRIISTKAIIR